mgnify:CR=1 FL=1
MWVIYMNYPDEDDKWYEYGRYSDQNRANEIAMQVRDSRGCWVKVIKEEPMQLSWTTWD